MNSCILSLYIVLGAALVCSAIFHSRENSGGGNNNNNRRRPPSRSGGQSGGPFPFFRRSGSGSNGQRPSGNWNGGQGLGTGNLVCVNSDFGFTCRRKIFKCTCGNVEKYYGTGSGSGVRPYTRRPNSGNGNGNGGSGSGSGGQGGFNSVMSINDLQEFSRDMSDNEKLLLLNMILQRDIRISDC